MQTADRAGGIIILHVATDSAQLQEDRGELEAGDLQFPRQRILSDLRDEVHTTREGQGGVHGRKAQPGQAMSGSRPKPETRGQAHGLPSGSGDGHGRRAEEHGTYTKS